MIGCFNPMPAVTSKATISSFSVLPVFLLFLVYSTFSFLKPIIRFCVIKNTDYFCNSATNCQISMYTVQMDAIV